MPNDLPNYKEAFSRKWEANKHDVVNLVKREEKGMMMMNTFLKFLILLCIAMPTWASDVPSGPQAEFPPFQPDNTSIQKYRDKGRNPDKIYGRKPNLWIRTLGKGNLLYPNGSPTGLNVSATWARSFSELYPETKNPFWLNINSSPGYHKFLDLIIKIDGVATRFPSQGGGQNRYTYISTVRYIIPMEYLRAMIDGSEVQIVIEDEKFTYNAFFHLTDIHLTAKSLMIQFLDEMEKEINKK